MAKKNLNPADAHRKALRKKELKKNKAERSKNRDFALVKKDTTDLEEEVERLEFATESKEKARYKEAKAELESIYKKKEAYLKEHPEQRRLVYRHKNDKLDEEIVLPKRNVFDKNGLPRHPERSIYYDPVMNVYGVAPPGMPYQERARLPGEVWSDDDDSDDDDVVMPDGPPPEDVEEDDSDDDIPMPEGPPPNQPAMTSSLPPPPPSLPHPPPPHLMTFHGSLPPRPSNLPLPPPPTGFVPNTLPPRPPGLPGASFPPGFPTFGGMPPPPPPGFTPQALPPPPPPGFFPTRNPSSIQDPLSSVPHQTYQAYQAQRATLPPKPSILPPGAASLPQKPTAAIESASLMSATVFAAPELRDFKKEATSFVPSNVRKKAAGPSVSTSSRVNAAPSLSSLPSKPGSSAPSSETSLPPRPDLLGSLKGKFGPTTSGAAGSPPKTKETRTAKETKPKDDYAKFVDSMADLIGPK
ncbi:hypothetical protein GGX14DRAFT_699460 [Mycena pura]|uniref:Wbp11/ELF5/Saf1 N-terminal domain-containing protein n=1 Tax=Mycena pura TaxID=153505 RepID=A0AAD6V3J7_9AGAR|nr:hypothetical protein GGX14DRAFT_699460 [Mycena pura]